MGALARWNFRLKQGGGLKRRFILQDKATGQPADLTGATARMQIRSSYTDPTVQLELTNANGGLVLAAVPGSVDVVITGAQTDAIQVIATQGSPPMRPLVHDAFITLSNGDEVPLWEGDCPISAKVTR